MGYERVRGMEMARRHRVSKAWGSGAEHGDPKDAEDRASRWPRGGGEVMNANHSEEDDIFDLSCNSHDLYYKPRLKVSRSSL